MKAVKWVFILFIVGFSVKGQTTLNHYLVLAAEQNPDIISKFKAYQAALEKVDQQGALPDPTLSFGYFISPIETRVGAQRFKLSLAQMFPWMGTNEVRRQLATSMAQVRFQEFQEAKNRLFLDVKTSWLKLYELEQEIAINEVNLEILKSYEPITRTKYESNLVPLSDLVRVQIKIDQGINDLELLKLKKEPLLSDFNTLLSRALDTSVTLPDSLDLQNNLRIEKDSITANNPSVQKIESQLVSIEKESALADLKRKPNIGLGLDYAFISSREGVNITENGKDALMPMVTLSLPVFGKKNKALKREVTYKKESAEARLESVTNTLNNQWNQVDFQLKSAEKELQLYTSEKEKTELLLTVLTSEYSNSNTNFEELLSTQQRLLQLQLLQIKANVKSQEAIFEKEYLTGISLNQVQQP